MNERGGSGGKRDFCAVGKAKADGVGGVDVEDEPEVLVVVVDESAVSADEDIVESPMRRQ